MLKRIITLLMAILLGFSTSATADEQNAKELIAKIVRQTNEDTGEIKQFVSVSGQLSQTLANKKIVIALVRPGVDETADIPDFSKYAMIFQDYISGDGSYQYEFLFSDNYGEYTVRVMADTLLMPLTAALYIPSAQEMSSLMVNLKNETITPEELRLILDQKGDELAIDTGIYEQLLVVAARTAVGKYIIDNMESYTAEAFNECFEKGVIINGIDFGVSGGDIKRIIEYYDSQYIKLNQNPLYSKFNDLTHSDKESVFSNMTAFSYSDIEDVRNGFYKGLTLVGMKAITSYHQIGTLLNVYKSYLDADAEIAKFSGFNADKREAAEVYITQRLSGFDTLEKLTECIKYAINNVDSIMSAKTSDGGTGGFGGGGGGGTSVNLSGGGDIPAISLDEITGNKRIFNDVDSSFWAFNPINELYLRSILSGKGDDMFYPNDNITRAEFVKIITTAFDLIKDGVDNDFQDVSENDWHYQYISGGVAAGIIKGISPDVFGVDDSITRQDAALILYRTLVLKERGFSNAGRNDFNDFNEIADYAKEAVEILYGNEFINGYADSSFYPGNTLSRAEAAQLIYNAINNEEGPHHV